MAFNKTMEAAFDTERFPALTPAQRAADPSAHGLTPPERLLLLTLCNVVDRRTAISFRRHETYAGLTGLSRATVIRAMATLKAQGWVVTAKRRRAVGKLKGTWSSDELKLVCPKVSKVPDRLLPLMTVVAENGGKTPSRVAPCNTVQVAPCNSAPASPSRTMQQHIPVSKNLSLARGEGDVMNGPVDKHHDDQVAEDFMALAARLKSGAVAVVGPQGALRKRGGS